MSCRNEKLFYFLWLHFIFEEKRYESYFSDKLSLKVHNQTIIKRSFERGKFLEFHNEIEIKLGKVLSAT